MHEIERFGQRPATTLAIAVLVLLASVTAGSCSDDEGNDPDRAALDGRFLVAFASNLQASAGGCHHDDFTGCDLYTATYDGPTGTISDLRRITSDDGRAEHFPSISTDGCWIAYNQSQRAGGSEIRQTIGLVHLPTLRLGATIDSARFPDWSPAGTRLAYKTEGPAPEHLFTADVSADCASGQLSLGTRRQVTTDSQVSFRAGDPDFFPDGETVSFNIDGAGDALARVAIVRLDGSGFALISAQDGSGHSFVREDGAVVGFGNSQRGGFDTVRQTETGWTAPSTLVSAFPKSAYVAFDSRYSECSGASMSYGGWMGPGGDQIIFGVQCYQGSASLFSRLFIVKRGGSGSVSLVDFGKAVETAAGGTGKDFLTSDVLSVPATPVGESLPTASVVAALGVLAPAVVARRRRRTGRRLGQRGSGVLALLAAASGLPGVVACANAGDTPQAASAPVLVYLHQHVEDHINTSYSENRFRRILPFLESTATAYPQYTLTLSSQFSGADTTAFAQWNATDGILDLVRGFRAKRVIELGYHGAHEPTYTNNPLALLPETATWEQRVTAGLQFLTCGKDPYRGGVDCATNGGTRLNAEIFGEVLAVSGTGGGKNVDPAVEHAAAALVGGPGGLPVMLGFPDHGSTSNPTYDEGLRELSTALGPTAETPPEVFWMNGRLRVNDGSPLYGISGLTLRRGADLVKGELAKLDRTRPHVINMAVGDKSIYAKSSPTGYAYSNPTAPQLPADLVYPQTEIDANYRRTQEAITYLVEEFFPQNPGSRFVSNRELVALAASGGYGAAVSSATIGDLAGAVRTGWSSRPPSFVAAGGGYFSLADSFGVLAAALSSYRQGGALPTSVTLQAIVGPLDSAATSGGATIAATDVLARCGELAVAFQDRAWRSTPSYLVPATLQVGAATVNGAEFLRLMADLVVAIGGGTLPATVAVTPTTLLPSTETSYAKMETPRFPGAILWSLKPALIPTTSLTVPVTGRAWVGLVLGAGLVAVVGRRLRVYPPPR